MGNLTLKEFIVDVPHSGAYSVLADNGGEYVWLGTAAQVAASIPTLLDYELRAVIDEDKQVIMWDTYNELRGESLMIKLRTYAWYLEMYPEHSDKPIWSRDEVPLHSTRKPFVLSEKVLELRPNGIYLNRTYEELVRKYNFGR